MKHQNKIILSLTFLLSGNILLADNNDRNIFESLVHYEKETTKTPINIRKKPLIERYNLSKYKLNAVIVSKKVKKILIQSIYTNQIFKLKEGDKIGKDGDKILKISNKSILIGKSMKKINKTIYIKKNKIGE
jgi:Tfp pilus assembly protein PilP